MFGERCYMHWTILFKMIEFQKLKKKFPEEETCSLMMIRFQLDWTNLTALSFFQLLHFIIGSEKILGMQLIKLEGAKFSTEKR